MVGLPYYLGVLTYNNEFHDIYSYFSERFSLVFLLVLVCSIVLACLSEVSGKLLLTQPATSP
jgi:hypothetical protein